jgi:ferritin-like metal-binding protein YciE
MEVTNPREKLVHELRMGYDEEHRYLEVQRQLMDLTLDEELKDLLERHTEETLGHIQNLKRIFAQMGQDPERAHNRAAEGMVEDARQGAQSVPEGSIRDCLIAGAQGRFEALEIAGYRELLGGAKYVVGRGVVGLLEQNLLQEEQTAR